MALEIPFIFRGTSYNNDCFLDTMYSFCLVGMFSSFLLNFFLNLTLFFFLLLRLYPHTFRSYVVSHMRDLSKGVEQDPLASRLYAGKQKTVESRQWKADRRK